jgi:putative heme-binding domain-containing protein
LLEAHENRLLAELGAFAHGDWAQRLMAQARERATNSELADEERSAAIALLTVDSWANTVDVYRALLNPSQPASVQQAAAASLQHHRQSAAVQLAIEVWPQMSPAIRALTLDWLSTFAEGRAGLIDGWESGVMNFAELSASQRSQLDQVMSGERWEKWIAHWRGDALTADRQHVFEKYREALASPAEARRGQEIFRRFCAECHQLENVGHAIGPNLASLQNRGADVVLLNVLEPNREVNPQYLSYTATTQDGRTITGMLQQETATSITLLRAAGQSDTLLRKDLEELRSSGVSLMPVGLEQQIPPAAMVDLIAYILSCGK